MHVCWWVFEGVFEAFFLYGAVCADLSCACDVGDVFVFFGEHEVGFLFAVCVVEPRFLGFIVVVLWCGFVVCHSFLWVSGLGLEVVWGSCVGVPVGCSVQCCVCEGF